MKAPAGRYFTDDELRSFGFRSLGSDVRIHERANIHGVELISLGDHVRIDQFTNLVATSPIDIGSHVHIAAQCHLSISHGLRIGDFSALGRGVAIIGASGDFEGELLNLPFTHIPAAFREPRLAGRVVLEGFNLVGMNSIVMPGVTLAEGSAVGMMSVVMADLQPWAFYLGSPARRIRDRSKEVAALARRVTEANGHGA